MSLDSLAGMFSQRTGAQQSMSGSIMNAIIGYLMQNMMQKGLSSLLGSGDSYSFCSYNYTIINQKDQYKKMTTIISLREESQKRTLLEDCY